VKGLAPGVNSLTEVTALAKGFGAETCVVVAGFDGTNTLED